QIPLADLAHAQLHRRDRVVDLAQQLGARNVAAAELGVAIAHVAIFAEHVADEVLEIAGEMEREIAARVCDSGGNLPQVVVIRVRFDLAAQRLQLARGDLGGPVFHLILPTTLATGQRANRDCCRSPHAGPSSVTRRSTGSSPWRLTKARVADQVRT